MKSLLGNTRIADLTFHKSGRINISSRIAKGLCLSGGDVIDIAEDNGEYYIYCLRRAPIGRHHGVVYPTSKNGGGFVGSSTTLARAILAVCKEEEKAALPCGEIVSLPIGAAYPIITKLKL